MVARESINDTRLKLDKPFGFALIVIDTHPKKLLP
jgi:hypothetical protein